MGLRNSFTLRICTGFRDKTRAIFAQNNHVIEISEEKNCQVANRYCWGEGKGALLPYDAKYNTAKTGGYQKHWQCCNWHATAQSC